MKLPKARTADLVEQETDKELLIYDLQSNKASMLNETSKNVFRACSGKRSFADLKREHRYTDDLIYLALDELKKNDLIQDDYRSPFAGMTRREAIRQVGLASMVALPVISGLIAPSAANAASGSVCGRSCTSNSDCGAGCGVCRGAGRCNIPGGEGGGSCGQIGSSCTSNGNCSFTCSNYSIFSCRRNTDCSFSGTCGGTGTCQA